MSFLENNKKVFLVLFTIYFIINIPLLINFNGIYWDDWTLVGHSLDTLNRTFFEAVGYAGYFFAYMHYHMINYLGVYSYRLLTFILLFLNSYFVFKILYAIPIFSSKDRFFITLFFLIAPLYDAKIALIDFSYTLHSTLFFFAFYILSATLNDLRPLKRILILVLFFISFLVNPLLVFYAMVLVYIFYKSYNSQICFLNNVAYYIKNNFDFILLPVLFFIVKSIWFLSSEVYRSDYNKISIYAILNPVLYAKSFVAGFLEPILTSLNIFSSITAVFIFFAIVCFYIFKKMHTVNCNHDNKNNMVLIILSVFVFAFGAMPYIAVGKIPASEDWSSRFQLLLPLGFAMVLYYGLGFLFKIKVYSCLFHIGFLLHSYC